MVFHRRRRYGKKKVYRRKLYKRRRYNKGRSKRATLSTMNPLIVPDRALTKLVFPDARGLTSTAGAIETYVYSGNDVFDPNYTGVGGQPTGYDKWISFYRFYKVYASKIQLIFHNVIALGTQGASFYCGVIANQDPSLAVATVPEMASLPYTKMRIFHVGAGACKISNYMTTEKIYGLNKKAVEVDTSYAALVTGSPTSEWYWNIVVQTGDMATTAAVQVSVRITYYVEFYGRNDAILDA